MVCDRFAESPLTEPDVSRLNANCNGSCGYLNKRTVEPHFILQLQPTATRISELRVRPADPTTINGKLNYWLAHRSNGFVKAVPRKSGTN